jgi:hypothetical protein
MVKVSNSWNLVDPDPEQWFHYSTHLDLAEVDRLEETRLSSHHRGGKDMASGGDDLLPGAASGVSVQDSVADVESDPSHVLVAEHTLK